MSISNLTSKTRQELRPLKLFKRDESEGEEEIDFSALLPKLGAKRERLEKYLHGEQEKIAEIDNLIPKLEEAKRNLQKIIKRKEEEMSRIDEIRLILEKF